MLQIKLQLRLGAQRDSRLAVYDLRETIESASAPVAVEFLQALTLVGDISCLEPIAAAGLVGLAFGNSPAAMPAWGGKRALLGTNPVAAMFPRASGRPHGSTASRAWNSTDIS